MSIKYIDPGCEKFIHESKLVIEAYTEACEWISSFGVPYEKTRFGVYEKDVTEFLKSGGSADAKKT